MKRSLSCHFVPWKQGVKIIEQDDFSQHGANLIIWLSFPNKLKSRFRVFPVNKCSSNEREHVACVLKVNLLSLQRVVWGDGTAVLSIVQSPERSLRDEKSVENAFCWYSLPLSLPLVSKNIFCESAMIQTAASPLCFGFGSFRPQCFYMLKQDKCWING